MQNFTEIINAFNSFCHDECLAFDAYQKPDMEAFNEAFDQLASHVVPEMVGALGLVRMVRPKSPLFYRMHKGDDTPNKARNIHKISHYQHQKYGEVWVIYCSHMNFERDRSVLSCAYFMTELDGELKIGGHSLYSDFASDGLDWAWTKEDGLEGLNFDSLGELLEVKRYLEPSTKQSREIYFENK